MFYETKVLDAYGKLKKIVSAEELKSRHWKIFESTEKNGSVYKKNTLKKQTPKTPSENVGEDDY